jgi:hypothetical protein
MVVERKNKNGCAGQTRGAVPWPPKPSLKIEPGWQKGVGVKKAKVKKQSADEVSS